MSGGRVQGLRSKFLVSRLRSTILAPYTMPYIYPLRSLDYSTNTRENCRKVILWLLSCELPEAFVGKSFAVEALSPDPTRALNPKPQIGLPQPSTSSLKPKRERVLGLGLRSEYGATHSGPQGFRATSRPKTLKIELLNPKPKLHGKEQEMEGCMRPTCRWCS